MFGLYYLSENIVTKKCKLEQDEDAKLREESFQFGTVIVTKKKFIPLQLFAGARHFLSTLKLRLMCEFQGCSCCTIRKFRFKRGFLTEGDCSIL